MHPLKTILAGLVLASPAMAANPIFSGADPHAAVIDGKIWIYPTRSEGGKNFLAFVSRDMKDWKKEGPILDYKDVKWLRKDTRPNLGPWAPCIARKGNKYYFYFSVGPQSEEHPSYIGVASGNSPDGPFRDSGKPLLTGGDGFEAIDPMVFEDPRSKKFYLYAGGSAGAKLRVYELEDDMVSIKRDQRVDNPEKFTEGAFMHVHDRLYHLTYSHGNWKNSTYSVHHATARTPTGPWRYRGKILSSNDRHKGPGHHSIIQFPPGGDWWIVYHRWNNREGDGPYKGSRETCIEKLVHKKNGEIETIQMTD